MCQTLEVGRSNYYDWLRTKPSLRMLENQRIAALMKEIFLTNRQCYGCRRIRKELLYRDTQICRRHVIRPMKQESLSCKTKRKFKITTDSNHRLPIAPNLLKRDFSALDLDEKYVGDITYIWIQEGWL